MAGLSLFTGLSGNTGLWNGNTGLWGGATGLLSGSGGTNPFPGSSLYLDLISGPLDSRVTFTRGTSATFVGSNGLIQSAAINVPRFDYNPATLAPLGLLIEEQRTNLLTYSADWTNIFWSKLNITPTAAAAVSPSGAVDAQRLQVTTTGLATLVTSSAVAVTTTSGATFSVYVKQGTGPAVGNSFVLRNDSTSTNLVSITLDYSTGAFVYVVGTTGASVTNAGNGWWRVQLSATSGITSGNSLNGYVGWSGGSTFTAGEHIFAWGAQLEAGAFATSYIPTVAAPLPRNADIATMTGTNFSSWYNASEGTFFASFEASPNTFTTYLAASNGVVAQNSMHMDNDGSGNMRATYYSGSAPVAPLTLGVVGTLGAVNNMATAYKVNDFAASRNGGTAVVDTLGAVPVGVNRLNIGADPSGAAVNVSNTHIRQVVYYNSRLPNAQLQTLSQPPLITTLSLDFLNGVYEG